MGIAFLAWICISAACDAIYRKCFNWIVITGGLIALVSISIFPESHPVDVYFLDCLIGVLAAFIFLFVFYCKKMMGAGDVKFAMALGLWVGWELLLQIWVLSCILAIVHGFLFKKNKIYFQMINGGVQVAEKKYKEKFIPYVTYLSLATVIAMGFYKN